MSNPSDNLNGGNPMAGGPAWSPAAFNQMHGPVYQDSELELPCYGCSFPKAIARMYRKYFVFSGRASRSEFWWAYLYLCILNSVLYSAVVVAEQHHQETLALILDALIFVSSLPLITLTFRRLHDTNRSGWWIFAPSIPSIAGIIVGLAIMYLTNRQFNDAMGAAAGGFTVMMIGFILDAVVWVWLLAGSSKPEGARFDKNSMVWVPGSGQVTTPNVGMQAGMTYQPMAPIQAPTAQTAPAAQTGDGNMLPGAALNVQGMANTQGMTNVAIGAGLLQRDQQFSAAPQFAAAPQPDSAPHPGDASQFGASPQMHMPDFGAPAQQLQAMQMAQDERTVTPIPAVQAPTTKSDDAFQTPAASSYSFQQPQQPQQSLPAQQPAVQDIPATPWNAQIPQTPAPTAPAWQQSGIAQAPATAAPMDVPLTGGQTFAPTNIEQPSATQPSVWQPQPAETAAVSSSDQSTVSAPASIQPTYAQSASAADQPATEQQATSQPTPAETHTTGAVLAAMPGVTFTPSSLGVPDMPAVQPQTVHGIQMPTETYTPDADFNFMSEPQTPVMPTDPAQAIQSVSFSTDEVHVPAQQFPLAGQPTVNPAAPEQPIMPAVPTGSTDFSNGITPQFPIAPTTPWGVSGQDSGTSQQ
ncbi:DUF805 domain-containing protein [Bifidobacterium apri]|uniref:DUF805 domain-containing protein n=1 Tax=Bifidobacterium apri TaxID=1769423 RepID=UPI003992DF02